MLSSPSARSLFDPNLSNKLLQKAFYFPETPLIFRTCKSQSQHNLSNVKYYSYASYQLQLTFQKQYKNTNGLRNVIKQRKHEETFSGPYRMRNDYRRLTTFKKRSVHYQIEVSRCQKYNLSVMPSTDFRTIRIAVAEDIVERCCAETATTVAMIEKAHTGS